MATTSNEVQTGQLKPRLSLLNGVTMIVGTIVGSGIFVSPKGVQSQVGSAGLSLVIWALSGLISGMGALCYAELGTTIVASGGCYSYIKKAFGDACGFVRLWMSIIIIDPTSQAAVSIIFAEYLIKPFFPSCDTPFLAVRLLAATLVLFLMAMNCMSVRFATRIQDGLSYAKILALVIIVIAGLVNFCKHGTSMGAFDDPWKGTVTAPGSLVMALYSGLYSFVGWDTLNFMAEELREPTKNLPRAIYISLPIITVIYLLTNMAYYAVLTTEELGSANAVALVFAQKTLGQAGWIMSIFVALSTFGTVNSLLYASSRLYYTAALNNHLPSYFTMISPERVTPIPCVLLSGSVTLVYLCVPNVFDLINYYSFAYWLSVGLAIAGQIVLRFRMPELPRPIKFSLAYPFAFTAVAAFLVIVPFFTDTINTLIGTAFMASAIPVYWLFFSDKGSKLVPKCVHTATHYVTCQLQKLVPVIADYGEADTAAEEAASSEQTAEVVASQAA